MRIIRKDKVLHPELSYRIVGVIFRVRKEHGRYRNEKEYGDWVEEELKSANISFEGEKDLGRNKVDFFIEGKIVLELKAKSFIRKEDYFQVKRYLEELEVKLGILANMRQYYVHPKRILNKDGKI